MWVVIVPVVVFPLVGLVVWKIKFHDRCSRLDAWAEKYGTVDALLLIEQAEPRATHRERLP